MANVVAQYDSLNLYDLTGGADTDKVEALLEIYDTLMPEYSYYRERMRTVMGQPHNQRPNLTRFYWLAEIDDVPAGLAIFEYIPLHHMGLLMDIAILPNFRQQTFRDDYRLAYVLVVEMAEQIKRAAKEAGNPLPTGLANEIERDVVSNLMMHSYHGIGIPIEYYEPPYVEYDKHLFDPKLLDTLDYKLMNLGIMPIQMNDSAREGLKDKDVWRRIVKSFYIEHYGLTEDNWAYQHAMKEIDDYTEGTT